MQFDQVKRSTSPEARRGPEVVAKSADGIKSQGELRTYAVTEAKRIKEVGSALLKHSPTELLAAVTEDGLSVAETVEAANESGVAEQLQRLQQEAARVQAEGLKAIEGVVLEGSEAPPVAKQEEVTPPLQEHGGKTEDWRSLLAARAEMTAVLRKEFSTFGADRQKSIEQFNAIYPDRKKGLELTVLQLTGESCIYLDKDGLAKELVLSKEQAVAQLAEIKRLDETLGRKGNSHDLRRAILQISEGKIKTAEAYTYTSEGVPKNRMKEYLDTPDNWVPERRQIQEAIVAKELEKAHELSLRLGETNAIFALRGNTAAGKTTSLKQHEMFRRAISPVTGQPDGAINPDTYKTSLKTTDAALDGWQSVTHFQTHEEGSMLARAISRAVETSEGASMIIDKRLNEKQNIDELVALTEKGKKLKVLDVDAPLEASLIRVLGRKAGGDDPLPPFEAVAEGFEGIRMNRASLLEEAAKNPKLDTYVLYAPGNDGRPELIAEKVPQKTAEGDLVVDEAGQTVFTIDIKNLEKVTEAINAAGAKAEVARLRALVITPAYIEGVVASQPPQQQASTRAILQKWQGKNFQEALDAHALEINEAVPSLEYYKKAALRNLDITSRTAKGTVDTSASKDKAEKMAAGLTPEKAADLAKGNFTKAMEKLYAQKDTRFESAEQVAALLQDIATTINGGILKEGELLRTGADSDKYKSYTKVADIPAAFAQFASELQQRLNDPSEDPVALAAWVEYRIDLTDHFFADGCGKSAKAMSSYVLMRAGQRLPIYRSRDEYYKNAPSARRDLDGKAKDDAQLQAFSTYFAEIVPPMKTE